MANNELYDVDENKIIDVVVDTQTIYGYVTDYLSDSWVFDNEFTDEQVEAIADKVVTASTDGRLSAILGEVWDSWIGQQFGDAVYEACLDFIGDEVRNIVKKED